MKSQDIYNSREIAEEVICAAQGSGYERRTLSERLERMEKVLDNIGEKTYQAVEDPSCSRVSSRKDIQLCIRLEWLEKSEEQFKDLQRSFDKRNEILKDRKEVACEIGRVLWIVYTALSLFFIIGYLTHR